MSAISDGEIILPSQVKPLVELILAQVDIRHDSHCCFIMSRIIWSTI
ncbi:uncharacterized protein RSE6_09499 [Rhynchosporium secalis]|uniref:Uncharacterized protein n=1 Tax=Rhynchosporium secalis TaxID=38038 RepID=A0A1E1MI22_RHYSE|nr:uncharacterized protein RSE6_09499 [Rhynchosporium secalis]